MPTDQHLENGKFFVCCPIRFFQDGDISVEDILDVSEVTAPHFRFAPGDHAMACPGVSVGTILTRLNVEQPSVPTALPGHQSPPPRPRNCISKNLELQLRGVRCGLGGRQPVSRSADEVAVALSTVKLLLSTSAASSSSRMEELVQVDFRATSH